jgi:hypothetical protein
MVQSLEVKSAPPGNRGTGLWVLSPVTPERESLVHASGIAGHPAHNFRAGTHPAIGNKIQKEISPYPIPNISNATQPITALVPKLLNTELIRARATSESAIYDFRKTTGRQS